MNIASIVVTYNRKYLLLRCIKAIAEQSHIPEAIFIIDNNSTDGTYNTLAENEVVNERGVYKNIKIEYVKLPKNGGGSLGFHEGLKRAHETGKYDAFWVMDDDGAPNKDCLKELIPYLKQADYISPLVVDIDNHDHMAFKDSSLKEFIALNSKDGETIKNAANPFNGLLFSKRYLYNVGYPKPEMFIWGDEINYDLRGRQHNMPPIMLCKAIHYHPRNRAQHSKPFFFNRKKVIFVDCKWKMYCRCCNAIYNYKLVGHYLQIIKEFFLYNWLFIITMHSWKWVNLFNKAFFNGLRGKFGGHYKYMNKN